MKGTDVTDAQIKHAEEFVMNSEVRGYDREIISIRKQDMFRLMAWYAAMLIEGDNDPNDLGNIHVVQDDAWREHQAAKEAEAVSDTDRTGRKG